MTQRDLPPAAFGRSLIGLLPDLKGFAVSLARDVSDADDIVQDTLLRAWASQDRFEPGSNLRAWTFTILRNSFYSARRKDARSVTVEPEKVEETAQDAADPDGPIQLGELQRALAELPQDQRDALLLAGAGGAAHEEIAELSDCAVGTVKSRLNRGRQALRAAIDAGAGGKRAAGSPAALILEETSAVRARMERQAG